MSQCQLCQRMKDLLGVSQAAEKKELEYCVVTDGGVSTLDGEGNLLIAVPLADVEKLPEVLEVLDRRCNGYIRKSITREVFTGTFDDYVVIDLRRFEHTPVRVLLIGTGRRRDQELLHICSIFGLTAVEALESSVSKVLLVLTEQELDKPVQAGAVLHCRLSKERELHTGADALEHIVVACRAEQAQSMAKGLIHDRQVCSFCMLPEAE